VDIRKTKQQLVSELMELRQRIAELEAAKAERKRGHESPLGCEEAFEVIFDNIRDGVALLDMTGKITRVNKSLVELGGYSEDELVGKQFSALSNVFPPRSMAKLLSQFAKMSAGHQIPPYEVEVCTKTGERRIAEIHNFLLRRRGKVVGFIVVMRDVTKRRQVEEMLEQARAELESRFEEQTTQLRKANEELLRQIAEREKAEECLKRYELMVESAQDAIFFKDLESRYLIANNGTLKAFGLPREEVIGKNDYEIMSNQEEAKKNVEDDRLVFKTGKATKIVKHMTGADGEERWFDAIKVPYVDSKGNIAGLIGIARDITDQKRAQEMLKSERDKLQGLIDGLARTGIGVDIVSTNHKVLFQNQFLTARFGDLTGRFCYDGYMGLKEPCDSCPVIEAIKGNKVEVVELTGADGRDYAVFAAPLPNPEGSVDKAIEVIIDITERKRAEEALLESEERYRALLQLGAEVGEAVVMLQDTEQGEGTQTFVSDEWLHITGYSREELLGKPFFDLVSPRDREASVERHRRKMSGEAMPGLYEMTIIRKDGAEVAIELTSAYTTYKGKKANVAYIRDITERKRAEETVRRQRDELSARARVSGRLLQTLDLHERLNVILSEVMTLVHVEIGAIYLVSGEELALRCWRGVPNQMREQMLSFPVEDAPSWIREISVFHEPLNEEGQIPQVAKDEGIQAQVSIPLTITKSLTDDTEPAAEWLGTLVLASRRHDALGKDDVVTLQAMAEELALAIDHSRQFYQASQRLRRLSVLREIDRAIIGHLSVHEILQIVVEGVPKELGGDAVAVSLFNEDRTKSQICLMRLPNGTVIEEEAFTIADSLLHWLIERQEPVIIYDLSCDPRVQMHSNLIHKHKLTSYLAMPLVAQDETVGILHILTVKPRVFAPEDVEFFQTLAGQAAIALRNAQLFEQARQSEQRYRTIFETTGTATIIIEEDTTISLANTEFEKLSGYSKGEIEGNKSWTEFVVEEDLERLKEYHRVRRIDPNAAPRNYEFRFIDRQGNVRDIVLAIAMIPGTKKSVASLLDITERKRAEAERRELERKAHLASRLATVGQMAAGIAHEINNPLTTVVGFAELLMARKLPEDVMKDLKVISDSAQRVADIVRRLLTFARQYRPERSLVNINELIKATLELRAYELETGNIKVTTELDPELPETVADGGQLQQVFLNLIINAEDEMSRAHGRGSLLIKTEMVDSTIRVSFTDDGPGIPRENLERIFEPFFSTKKVGEGTGLGLSICHGIITEHNGRIYAESEPGKGATFIVELPVVSEEKEVKPAEPEIGGAREAVKARILVVDDEPAITQFLSRVLMGEGYEVKTIDNAETALKLIERERYSLILLDIKLPGMSGFELYESLKKVNPSLARRTVFITGDVLGTDTRNFLSRTNASYITKPFNIEKLKKEIKRLLARTK